MHSHQPPPSSDCTLSRRPLPFLDPVVSVLIPCLIVSLAIRYRLCLSPSTLIQKTPPFFQQHKHHSSASIRLTIKPAPRTSIANRCLRTMLIQTTSSRIRRHTPASHSPAAYPRVLPGETRVL